MNSSEQKSEGKVSTSVLVLGLNGKRYLERCLSSLSNQTYSDYKVIYIDAASTDGSSDYVSNNYPNVDVLQLEENLGFTGGNNKGIEYAKAKYNSDFVVTINNDTWVEPEWLEKLLEPMSDPNIAVTTSLIFLYYPYIFVDFVSQEDAIVKNIYINKPEYRVLVYDLYKDTEFAKFPLEIAKDKKYKIAIPCTLINDSNNLIFESTQKLPITLNVGIVDYYSEENNIVLSRDEINENIFEIIQKLIFKFP